ncbi:MAG: Zinc ribbon domain protein [Chloroflexi bacterium ADurb.Bin325]|nr:MAG: Zinc ribbon domain protein [Chloroflexi bacterium ADurb.Bin325]
MPTYEYECEQCGVRFERLQRMTDPALVECPECGGHVHRVMQPVGVIFKGSGFYVTDNKGKSSTGIPGGKKKEEETHAADGKASDSKPAAAASASSDAAPAAGSTTKKAD